MSLSSELENIDQLYEANENEKSFELISKLYNSGEKSVKENPEIMWRYARGSRDIANIKGVNDKDFYSKQINSAYEIMCEAIKLAPENPDVNKWYAIFTELAGRLVGIKKRIENSYIVRDHLEKANSLRPSDFSTLHSIGVWHYEVSNLGWANVMFAKAFFGTPPSSTFDNALKYLQEAENLKPNFFASNTMYLANTYYKLGKKADAKKYCQNVLDNTGTDLDAIQAKDEAKQLLKRL